MLTREQMPNDNADLAKIPVELPTAPSEKINDPESFLKRILEYLETEDYIPDGELEFLRTAQVDSTIYYIWSFKSNGDPCFATLSIGPHGVERVGCYENYWGLTPEQFMLADYHQCF